MAANLARPRREPKQGIHAPEKLRRSLPDRASFDVQVQHHSNYPSHAALSMGRGVRLTSGGVFRGRMGRWRRFCAHRGRLAGGEVGGQRV